MLTTSSIQDGDVLVEPGGITILVVHIEELPEFMKSVLGTHHIWWIALAGMHNPDNHFKINGPWICGPKIQWQRKE